MTTGKAGPYVMREDPGTGEPLYYHRGRVPLPAHWRPLPEVEAIQRAWRERHEKRFVVLASGRRSLKTHLAKMRLVEAAIETPGSRLAAVSLSMPAAERVFLNDLRALSGGHPNLLRYNKTGIYFSNGSEITWCSPRNVAWVCEGRHTDGVVLDGFGQMELARHEKRGPEESLEEWHARLLDCSAWKTVRDAALGAWIWVTGIPGRETDADEAFYALFRAASYDTTGEYGAYRWSAEEVITPEEWRAAREELSPEVFRTEYEARF